MGVAKTLAYSHRVLAAFLMFRGLFTKGSGDVSLPCLPPHHQLSFPIEAASQERFANVIYGTAPPN